MELTNETVLVRSEGPLGTSIPGETVILDPVKGVYFGLEGVGARVWELIEDPVALGVVLDALEAEYDVDRPTLEYDVRNLVADLIQAGLARTTSE